MSEISTMCMGTILVIVGGLTIKKIYYGSKVPFAYTMTTFSIIYGLAIFIISLLFYYNNFVVWEERKGGQVFQFPVTILMFIYWWLPV